MDPFIHLFCRSCANLYMYCDCVESFVDVIQDGDDSHESEDDSEGEDDFDFEAEGEQNQNEQNNDSIVPVVTPTKKRRPEDEGIVVDKPESAIVPHGAVTPSPGKKSKILPDFANPQDALENYYGGPNKIPRPFLTTQRNEELINMGMPVNTGPYDPNNTDFSMDLWDWYTNLSPSDKQFYNEACFVTSSPKESFGEGKDGPHQSGDLKVILKTNPTNDSGGSKYEYTVVYPDNSEITIKSDIRLPDRAFDGESAIEEYFFQDGDYWRPKYKFGRTRSGRRDLFYVGDSMGSRMARNPNQWGGVDPPTSINANPEVAEPDDPKPLLTNNVRNTRSLLGIGTNNDPFRTNFAAANVTKFTAFSNAAQSGGGGAGYTELSAKDNQGDPLFGVIWYSSGTGNQNSFCLLNEMINENGIGATFALVGFTGYTVTAQTITFKIWSPATLAQQIEPTSPFAIHHEVMLNGTTIRNLSDTTDVTFTTSPNVPFSLYAKVRCDPEDPYYNKAKGYKAHVYFQPITTISIRLQGCSQLVKTNTLIAVGEPDVSPGTQLIVNGENVAYGSQAPISFRARGNGTLPPNSVMDGRSDWSAKVIAFTKGTYADNIRLYWTNITGTRIRTSAITFAYTGYIIPLCRHNGTTNPNTFGSSFQPYTDLNVVGQEDQPTSTVTDEVYEREYSYLVYNNVWLD